jgi:Fe-S-cluster containining protein
MKKNPGSLSTWLRKTRQVLDAIEAGRPAAINVPCGACTACCHGYETEIGPQDDPSLATVPGTRYARVLPKGPDGNACLYLVENQCTVYAKRPESCRVYDCRQMLFTGMRGIGRRPYIDAAIEQWDHNQGIRTDDDRRALAVIAQARSAVIQATGGSADDVELIAFATTSMAAKINARRGSRSPR